MKGFYKVAIKQGDALFFLAFSNATAKHFMSRVEGIAKWFPTSLECIEALHNYCRGTFRGQLNQVPMVVIKRYDCPLVEKKNEKPYDAFDFFDGNSIS